MPSVSSLCGFKRTGERRSIQSGKNGFLQARYLRRAPRAHRAAGVCVAASNSDVQAARLGVLPDSRNSREIKNIYNSYLAYHSPITAGGADAKPARPYFESSIMASSRGKPAYAAIMLALTLVIMAAIVGLLMDGRRDLLLCQGLVQGPQQLWSLNPTLQVRRDDALRGFDKADLHLPLRDHARDQGRAAGRGGGY